jgi:Divergent InlB B-repeat domain
VTLSRPRLLGTLLAVAVVVIMLGSSLGLAGAVLPAASTSGGLSTSPSAAISSNGATGTAAAPAAPAGLSIDNSALNSSGRGTFYNTHGLPGASFANETCIRRSCYSVTNDVATTVTPGGLLVAAYTTLTHESPCVALRPYSVSNIAIATSLNGGGSWSAVKYVGNPTCASSGYPDAWEPSIASLSNGTLVLVYVEYNLSAFTLPPLTPTTWPPTESRLVFTESYDAGVAWTTPQVLNISNPASAPPGLQFTPALPSVATSGNTIYVTWMSLTIENSFGNIALLVSTNGGRSWSPTVPVSTGLFAGYSMDPQAVVGRNGELYIAYTSNVTLSSFFCGANGCVEYFPAVWEGSVWVASSTSNGTLFSYTDVAPNVPLGTPAWAPGVNPTSYGPFETPAPQIAYSATTHQLFVAFSAGEVANNTTFCFYGADGCLADNLYFYNSSDAGQTWTAGNIYSTVFNASDIDPSTFARNATDSVTSVAIATVGATVDVEAAFYDGGLCDGVLCGVDTEVVFSTSNDGSSFTVPATVAADYTPLDYAWSGEYSSIAVVAGTPKFFWTLNACPGWATTPCGPYPSSPLPVSQVELSTLVTGNVGATLSFVAAGVGSPTNWTVSVLGNVRGGPTTGTLSVSDVPTGVAIFFVVPGINETNVRYYVLAGSASPGSPVTLSGNLTVTVTFVAYVPVTIAYRVPNIQGPACLYAQDQDQAGCPSFYPGCLGAPFGNFTEACYSYYFNPVPPAGEQWVPSGHVDTVGLSPFPMTCDYPQGGAFGYVECYIMEFTLDPLGWTGSGPGSVSTSGLNVSFTPRGPVTETASFLLSGYCMWFYDYFPPGTPYLYSYGCQNFTDTLTIAESGLPAGSTWGVTLSGAAGSGTMQALAGQPIVNNTAAVGTASISAWNVPSTTPGDVWVGTPSIASPMFLPAAGPVTITYTLEPIASISVPVTVTTLGLPAGLAGNVTFDDVGTGANTAVSAVAPGTTTNLSGGQYTVTAAPIITTDGVEYYPSEIYSDMSVINDTNQSGNSPTTITLEGPTTVILAYTAQYWVDIVAGAGGTVSPSSQWVSAGGTITLSATADTGYSFLYWVGTGAGSTSGPSALLSRVAIQPNGPVTELAAFGVAPPAAWTVTLIPYGMPNGQEYSVSIGGQTYSGVGSFPITNLSTGTYTLSFPNASTSGVSPVLYSLSSVTATAGLSGNQLTINGDLSLLPVYQTNYLIAVSETPGGSLNVPAGSSWQLSNSTFSATATPSSGYAFAGWWVSVGDGPSSLASNLPLLQMVVTGSVNLVAQFVSAPVVHTSTYTLSLQESGLPSGVMWQVTLTPGNGASGTSSVLSASGLNGSYVLSVAISYSATGVRYVPTGPATQTVTVTSNQSMPITFVEQVLVSVSTSGSGGASGGGWYNATTSVPLVAAPAPAGWTFVGWQGTGTGSYSGPRASETITPAGPVTETATYAPASTTTSGSASTPWTDFLILGIIVAALLVIGLAEGFLSGRKRKPPTRGPVRAQPLHPEVAPYSTGTPAPPKSPAAPAPSAPASPPPATWNET